MADFLNTSRTSHLDATGPRSVVYCHQCEHEWWEDEYGLECPYCEGNVTEIVKPGPDDPRRVSDSISTSVSTNLRPSTYRTWTGSTTDSDDTNVEEYVSHGPSNSSIIFRTIRTSNPRGTTEVRESRDGTSGTETRHVLTDFRNMISGLLGPQFRHSAPGRSGPETLFSEPSIQTSTFRFGGNGTGHSIVGGRIIVNNIHTSGGGSLRPRNANEPQAGGAPQVDDIVSIISNILAPTMMNGGGVELGQSDENDHQTRSPGFQTLFSSMFNPRNARFGDAVYSQEALDQILTQLMEQSTASNAPGPAPDDAIAALPKRKLDAELLGSEGKAECSICMDEIKLGDEVVVLPCKHWFDESCVTAWLKEHNTCPICRKGITGEPTPTSRPNPGGCQANVEAAPAVTRQTRQSSEASSSANRQNRQSSEASSSADRQNRQGSSRSIFIREARIRNFDRNNSSQNAAGGSSSEDRHQQRRSPRTQERDDNLTSMPGSFPSESSDNTDRNSRRSSNNRNGGNVGRSSTFHRIRGLHERLNNNYRNN